jgi:hypothetical protein
MPHQASDGRVPAPGMPNAYTATDADMQTHTDAQAEIRGMTTRPAEFDITHNPNRYVFVAAFDGTGNDATQTLTEATNVHALYDDFDRFIHGDGPNSPGFSRMHARYIEGPGTQSGTIENTRDNASGASVQDRVFEMYKDLGEKTLQWKKENPDAEISVVTFGFSRGAVEAAEFASVVGKYGIHANVEYAVQNDDDSRNNTRTWTEALLRRPGTVPALTDFRNLSDEVVAPGKVPIVAGLFDPVATGIAADRHDRELPRNITGALQISAIDEHRTLFPVNDIVNANLIAQRQTDLGNPERFANVSVAGCHSDIGGGYSNGKGLADSSKNMMGTYLNGVLGHEICREVAVDREQCVVHDSNSRLFQYMGRQQTGHWFADRSQAGVTQTPDGQYSVASGIDPNLHGRSRVEMPSVNMLNQATMDDSLRPPYANVETRLDPRHNDDHTPRPPEFQHALESTNREIDPTKLLLESSTRISTLMDPNVNPTSAQILRDAAGQPDTHASLQAIGDSPQGRLSAAVALAASRENMDRIGEIAFNHDRSQLLIADRRDTHGDLVSHATVDIATALRTPMIDSMRELNPGMARPQTMYEQAHQQLLVSGFAAGDPQALVDGAARIASQARHDGLASIDRLELQNNGGHNAVVAHQNGREPSQPVEANAFTALQPNAQNAQQDVQGHGNAPRMH